MVGFDAKNKDIIGSAFLCRICSLVLRDPVQLGCTHRHCRSCVDSIDCEIVKCAECKTETPKKEVLFDRGFKNDMQTLSITCSLCDWSGALNDYQNHLQQVHPNPVCEYCGKKFDSANNLNVHKLSQCDKITVYCVLKAFGCSELVVRVQMSSHYMTEQHQTAIISFVRSLAFRLPSDQYERGSGMDIDLLPHTTTTMISYASDNTNGQLQEVYETIDILAGGIQTLNEDVQCLSSESLRILTEMEILNQNFSALKISIQEQSAFLDGLKPNQEILNQNVASLKQKVEDMQFVSYDGTLVWKISKFKEKMGNISSAFQFRLYKICHCQSSINLLSNKSLCCSLYSISMEDSGNFEGEDGFNQVIFSSIESKLDEPSVDAQSERQSSIYSPPFYTSPTGYKICARLYLYGDGNARRTHISLFFVLMRGEYDGILKFPFNYKVTFCLYDQTPAQRHIIDSFRPDIKSNSFQRPRSEMNIASGIPKFFPLAVIQEEGNSYVRDDTMFIKVMVDFGDMPKTLLPYALSLNPGLPMNVQQGMIKQEVERRTQQTPTVTNVLPQHNK